jgi:hypothetical protein
MRFLLILFFSAILVSSCKKESTTTIYGKWKLTRAFNKETNTTESEFSNGSFMTITTTTLSGQVSEIGDPLESYTLNYTKQDEKLVLEEDTYLIPRIINNKKMVLDVYYQNLTNLASPPIYENSLECVK